MLKSFTVSGFKPFGKPVTVNLGGLTFLVGPNGSGKTSLFEAMALLAQSVDWRGLRWDKSPDNPTASPTWVNLPKPPSVLFKQHTDGALQLGFTMDLSRIPGARDGATTFSYSVTHRKSGDRFEDWEHLVEVDSSKALINRKLSATLLGDAQYKDRYALDGVDKQPHAFPDVTRILSEELFPGQEASAVKLRSAVRLAGRYLCTAFSYVGTERGPAFLNRSIEPGRPAARTVGKRGEDSLAMLAQILGTTSLDSVAQDIREWAKEFGLAKISGGWRGGDQLGCDFLDPVTKTVIGFDLSGFGSAQLLPLIIELFASPKPSTILIEEPEISLHVEAASRLPVLLATAVKQGRQVLVSTHSEVLLSDLHLAIDEAGLPASKIKVLHCERNADGVSITELPVNAKGVIEGWIPSFIKAEDRSSASWFNQLEPRK